MHRKQFDLILITSFLVLVASSGIRVNAKRRVMEGATSGPTGIAAQTAAVAL